jgi:2-hydroxycyclohexanecarboxyl-CoA dehydrogenase
VEPARADEVSEQPRVVVVTRAGGVLGQQLVATLLSAGWRVAAYDAIESPAELPGSRSLKLDLHDRDEVARELSAAERELGPIDGLAVLPAPLSATPIGEIAAEQWHAALRAQLLVAANFAWAVLPAMLARGAGNIVTVGSDTALGAPGIGVHAAAASGAVIGFAKALAIELAKTGVQVNAVVAETAADADAIGAGLGAAAPAAPESPPAEPGAHIADVAATAAYLLGERHFFLGQLLSANGARR